MTSSTGAAVRLHRNAVRHRPDSLSAFKWKACPPSPESAESVQGADDAQTMGVIRANARESHVE